MTTTAAIEAIQSPSDPQGHDEFDNVRQRVVEHAARGAAQPKGHETLVGLANARRRDAQLVIDTYEPTKPATPAGRAERERNLAISRDAVRAYGELVAELEKACGALCAPRK